MVVSATKSPSTQPSGSAIPYGGPPLTLSLVSWSGASGRTKTPASGSSACCSRQSSSSDVFPVTDLDTEATYDQNSPGVPGVAEAGDRFGRSLAVVEGATERVLLVGVPDDATNNAGMVGVIPSGGGVPRAWVPGAGGIPAGGAVRFGASLASVTG